jgi:hypothetical protein
VKRIGSALSRAPSVRDDVGRRMNDHTIAPEYIRLPRPKTRCPVTGLARTTLEELVVPCARNGNRPPVISRVVKQPHATRGIRLIHLPSLLAYIEKQSA